METLFQPGVVVPAADDHFCRKATGQGRAWLGEFRDGAKINNVSGKGDGDVPAYLAKSETGPGVRRSIRNCWSLDVTCLCFHVERQ